MQTFLAFAGWLVVCSRSNELAEPNVYHLVDGGDYYLNVNYCSYTVENEFNFTGRCWCWYDMDTSLESCSIPGPTLVTYNGSSFTLTVRNKMTGSDADSSFFAQAKDPDVTNLHTHGLHVSGEEDNPLIVINPGKNHTYDVNIPSDHYPGTHWYHSHHHGSVGWQLRSGLYGALIVKYDSNSTDNNSSFFKIDSLKSHILLLQYLWTHSEATCDCDDSSTKTYESEFTSKVGQFGIHSACYTWCSIDETQRTATGAAYDFASLTSSSIDDNKYLLVNGQYNSIINININNWNILKLINADVSTFTQFAFNDTSDTYNCNYYLLSRDGIYFKDGPRNITMSPTFGYVIIPPGGRADVAIKCENEGLLAINLVQDNIYDELEYIPRMDSGVMFYVNITNNSDSSSIISELPMETPSYPLYLQSLLDDDNESVNNYEVYTNCSCADFDYDASEISFSQYPEITFSYGECGFELQLLQDSGPIYFGINNQLFNDSGQYYLNFESIYEFYVGTNSHPIHQHVSPFQLTDTYINGILGEKGDFLDTFGTGTNFTYRTITLDYTGHVVVHCHMVDHEDEGMMTYYTINEDTVYGNESYCNNDCIDDSNSDTSDTSGTNPSGGGGGPGGGPGRRRQRRRRLIPYCDVNSTATGTGDDSMTTTTTMDNNSSLIPTSSPSDATTMMSNTLSSTLSSTMDNSDSGGTNDNSPSNNPSVMPTASPNDDGISPASSSSSGNAASSIYCHCNGLKAKLPLFLTVAIICIYVV